MEELDLMGAAAEAWQLFKTHFITSHNVMMVGATWIAIWLFEKPLVTTVERFPLNWQLNIWGVVSWVKPFAAPLLCLGLVWVPTVQPPLCSGDIVTDCQTVFGRVATGIVCGGALSWGHKKFIAPQKRKRGISSPVPHEVTRSR